MHYNAISAVIPGSEECDDCDLMLARQWFEFPRVCVPGCSGDLTPSILGSVCRISEPFQAASYRDSPPAAHRGGGMCCGPQRLMISQNHRICLEGTHQDSVEA